MLGFALLAGLIGALLILEHGPTELQILLMVPIIGAALFYPRHVYLPMLAFGICASAWVILALSTNPHASFKTLTMLAATTVLISEVVHWLMQARMRAASALRASDARYRQMFEHNQAIKLVIDSATGVIVDANAAACAFYGYSREELTSKHIADVNVLDRTQIAAAMEQVRIGRQSAFIFRHRCASGAIRDVEVHSGPIDIDGRPMLFSIVHDITERVRAERRGAAFVALGQKLSAAATPEAAARIIAAVADELLGWDACLIELYSAHGDTTTAILLVDTIDGQRVDVPPLSSDPAPSNITRRVMAEGGLLLFNDELSSNCWDLDMFGDTERPSATLMFVPIRSGDTPIGVMSIQSYTQHAYSDAELATLQALADHCGGALERTRAEALLRENEARYRAVSELTSDYYYSLLVTPDGQLPPEWVAGAFSRITGYTQEEFEARGGWRAIVHPDDLPISDRRAQRVLSGRTDVSELRITTKLGETRWLRAYTRPEWSAAAGRVVRVFGAIQDITERRRAEESLLHRQKLESLGILAGGIAHDFNNLLAAIIGNAELALNDIPLENPATESIGHVQAAARRAADLTRQMLAYAGKGRFVLQHLNLNAVIAEMATLLQTSIAKNVAVQYRLAERLPAIEADTSQISQVVLNLIVNAAEAIGAAAGTITITTGVRSVESADLAGWMCDEELTAGKYVLLEIADTGCGMDAATRMRIFEPFFSTKFTGRGLGLAAVLGIVRSHAGALHVKSQVGGGTTFSILLPAIECQDDPRTEDPQRPIVPLHASPAGSRLGRILVVDDEPSVRAVMVRMLERLGFSVLEASDGRAGVEAFQVNADTIACVLLDLTMPDLSGQQALSAIRQIRLDTRVVLMSGYDEQELSAYFGQGVAGFLHKPFTLADLRQKLQQVFE